MTSPRIPSTSPSATHVQIRNLVKQALQEDTTVNPEVALRIADVIEDAGPLTPAVGLALHDAYVKARDPQAQRILVQTAHSILPRDASVRTQLLAMTGDARFRTGQVTMTDARALLAVVREKQGADLEEAKQTLRELLSTDGLFEDRAAVLAESPFSDEEKAALAGRAR